MFTQEQLDAAIEKWHIKKGMQPPVLCLLGDRTVCPAGKTLKPGTKCPNCQESRPGKI